MKKLLALFLILFSSVISPVACSGQISQYVPAVVGQYGGLVNVTISLAPGDGDTYVTVYPRTGVMTQESVDDAVSYAYTKSGRERDCDVLVSFDAGDGTGYVDGPSAGAALTVMAYALLENQTMRQDTIITGTIEGDGNIGTVGGLYEKARGAASMGADYFITPMENFYEMLLLKNVEEDYEIKLFQVRKIDDVIGFMIYNKTIEQRNLTVEKREIPDLEQYGASEIREFIPVVERMIELEQGAAESITQHGEEASSIRDFYGNEVERQTRLLEQGYLFSAANEAFLNYIDISTIAVILSDDIDLPRKKGETSICLSSLKIPNMTDRNFEWLVGANLRMAWAENKLNTTEMEGELLTEEKYIAYNNLMYGKAWCEVAKGLLEAAPDGGSRINETSWKGMAEIKIDEANELQITDAELQDRVRIAETSYSKGRYGAAIYDAVYVAAMSEAAAELSADYADAEKEAGKLLEEDRIFLWPRIYQSQGAFLYEQGEDESAYKILKFARALDEATAEMNESLVFVVAEDVQPEEKKDWFTIIAASATIIFLFMALLIWKWRSDGHKRARSNQIVGVKQKKSRARVQKIGIER